MIQVCLERTHRGNQKIKISEHLKYLLQIDFGRYKMEKVHEAEVTNL